MNESDRARVLELLRRSSSELQESVLGIEPAEAARRPADGGWTIAEIVEHVAVAEEQMYTALTTRYREMPEANHNTEKEQTILRAALDRSRKVISPEVSKPTGRFGTLAAGLAHFRDCRARTVAYVEQCRDDLRRRTVKHPIAGVVTDYEYLTILALHPSRHAEQIRERSGAGD